MPTHHYSRVPDENPLNRLNRSYYTGLPTLSTAPPSFHSVALSDNLPHRNDETAATVIPPPTFPRAEDNVTDPGISLYAPSNPTLDLEAAREDTVARLVTQVELLERRVEDQSITIRDGVQKFQERMKNHMGRRDTGHMIVQKLGVGLWVLCIIGVIAYFTRPVTVQK
ncbi:hypothetical protein N431DRAFT_540413 [Stipitochalara longipes BDJ]|nr:hypothetical protein N431DRAFT_540413 [Stipitochalara longipes BDJ]